MSWESIKNKYSCKKIAEVGDDLYFEFFRDEN